MNPKARKFLLERDASMSNATRYADGVDRLEYDMDFVSQFIDTDSVCVDLCCGTGMMSVRMADLAKKVYAVDFNPLFLDQMEERDNIVKVTSDANSYICSEACDLITIFGAIQYNTGDDVKQIYENCRKMLKDDGALIVSGQWGVNGRVIVDRYSEELQRQYFAEYRTLAEEQATLAEAGFDSEVVTILPERFNHYEDTHFYAIVGYPRV